MAWVLWLETVSVGLTYEVLDKHHRNSIALPSRTERLGGQLTIVLEDKPKGWNTTGLLESVTADDAAAGGHMTDLPEEHAGESVAELNPLDSVHKAV